MDQLKLTKAEWNAIEVPLSDREHRIMQFLQDASLTPTMKDYSIVTVVDYLKIKQNDSIDLFLAHKYFSELKLPPKESIKLKKADIIRLNASDVHLPANLYEFVLLEICKMVRKNPLHYYTLHSLFAYDIPSINIYVKKFVRELLDSMLPNLKEMVLQSVDLIENNKYIYKYQPLALYDHQKQLYNICKLQPPKLVLYMSQTGSGKTLSPIGACSYYKGIIFVCAHKNIGLALARAAISVEKKIAIAFGAKTVDDIKLHYYSVSKCTRDKRTGKIRKVDNSEGQKVELMICDVESFVSAKEYMLKFNTGQNLMVWMDEPTITLDYEIHALHEIYKRNWVSNTEIPNVVLSSATLPNDMSSTIHSFQQTFPNAEIHRISCYDMSKTVQMLNPDNQIELPHYHCPTWELLQDCIQFMESKLLVMKYFDLIAVVAFLKKYAPDFSYFKKIEDITIASIKLFYIQVLKTFTNESWGAVYEYECAHRISNPSTIELCTKDAWTLENGPTIYIAPDVDLIAKYCIKTANIPDSILGSILKNLGHNSVISDKIAQLEKDLEDTNKEDDKEKKMVKNNVSAEVKILQIKLKELHQQILPMVLPDEYIPNKKAHLTKFGKTNLATAFSSNVDSTTAKEILALDVDNKWKLLLLMGIGVFALHTNSRYTELMKQLASQQNLYLIIADSDHIYGTNFQFCQGYMGKGLRLTQEKLIQAMGRIGRGIQGHKNSFRFRDINDVKLLFLPQLKNPEIENMKKLYA
jgi:hypothetical protein